jgi:beta-glucosidase-like glycosyl hydrolase
MKKKTCNNSENRMNEQELIKQAAYAEAMHYMANAQETLQKARKENNRYLNPKLRPHSLRHGLQRCAGCSRGGAKTVAFF